MIFPFPIYFNSIRKQIHLTSLGYINKNNFPIHLTSVEDKMDSVLPISDDCEMYLVRTEAHEQHVEGKDEFERKPLIVNGIDSTITLEIDKETLIERMQEYYGGKVNPDVVLIGHEQWNTLSALKD